ncbi:MAG: RnfABCDGE type electron transport complex subunit G [Lachnospiraceae bacterium]
MSKIIKDCAILFVITLVAGFILGGVYEITKEPIAKQEEAAKQEAYKQVFKDAASFEATDGVSAQVAQKAVLESGDTATTINEVLAAVDAEKKVIGYVFSVTNPEGYGGNIQLSVGIKNDGTINGYEVLSISETAGLGMKATEAEFKDQFKGKKAEKLELVKTGAKEEQQVDAISGATITSTAVTKEINACLAYVNSVKGGK